MYDEALFDVFTVSKGEYIKTVRIFERVSMIAAAALGDYDNYTTFMDDMENNGWCGSSPAWNEFRPIIIMPEGQLLRYDQFRFLAELLMI